MRLPDGSVQLTYRELYEQVRFLLGRVTYKPGWKLVLSPMDDYQRWIEITTVAEMTSLDGRGTTVLQRPMRYDAGCLRGSEEWLLRLLVVESIRWMEMHEMDEWLKLDGLHMRDPHPEKKEMSI